MSSWYSTIMELSNKEQILTYLEGEKQNERKQANESFLGILWRESIKH
jgi:hypothetical protein